MALVGAVATLAAAPQLTAFTSFQRIRITPGNVPYGDAGVYGQLATDSYVVVPGVIDGTYSP
jgi:hypothetical protein